MFVSSSMYVYCMAANCKKQNTFCCCFTSNVRTAVMSWWCLGLESLCSSLTGSISISLFPHFLLFLHSHKVMKNCLKEMQCCCCCCCWLCCYLPWKKSPASEHLGLFSWLISPAVLNITGFVQCFVGKTFALCKLGLNGCNCPPSHTPRLGVRIPTLL